MPDVSVFSARPHRLLPQIIHRIGALHQQRKPCIMLVPEQFTLQAEREILDRLHLNGLFDIEVISPTRLRNRISAVIGMDDRAPLSSAGQHMAISFALERCADQLQYYRGIASRHGFMQKLTALIADMKRGGLMPETLAAYADTLPDGMRKEKHQDLAILYQAYNMTMENRIRDADDLNLFVAQHMRESTVLNNHHVFTYGFDTMSEPMIVLLTAIGNNAESLTVGLICDSSSANDEEIYLPVRQSIARFRQALEALDIKLVEKSNPPEPLGHAPAIDHLDDMLFAYPQHTFEGNQNNVYISQFNSPL